MEADQDPNLQILALAWRYRARPRSSATFGEMVAHMRPERSEDFEEILLHLREQGLLEGGPEGWRVAESAHAAALSAKRRVASGSFDRVFRRLTVSPAAQEYNRRVYGWEVFSFNMVEHEQRAALVEACGLSPGKHFVDLGCATGAITNWLATQTGANGLGLDIAPSAIDRAKSPDGLVTFQVADMDALALPSSAFDVVTAVDTLYFSEDLSSTLAHIWRALVPGGRLVAFFSVLSKDPESLEFEACDLGRALPPEAVVETQDFTAEGHGVWLRGRKALDALRDAFEAEGSHDLWRGRDAECRAVLKRYEDGEARRYLVVATKP